MKTSQRPRTRLDPEVRREQIVEAAAGVFEGRDPADVTFEEIAEAAGVSRALIYTYFGDKGGLTAAVYLRSLGHLDDELALAVDADSEDAERLRTIIACYLRYASEQSSSWRLIASTATVDHPDVVAARRQRFDELAGAWGGTAESRVAARAVVGFLEAATLDWIDRRDLELDGIADLLSTILWSGLSSVDDGSAHLPRGETASTVIG